MLVAFAPTRSTTNYAKYLFQCKTSLIMFSQHSNVEPFCESLTSKGFAYSMPSMCREGLKICAPYKYIPEPAMVAEIVSTLFFNDSRVLAMVS